MTAPERRLLLVRHGETAYNRAGRYQGHLDIPLNDAGEQQAAAIGRRLAGWPLTAVYSSDLQRSAATAAAIARPHDLPLVLVRELREANLGVLQGRPVGGGNPLHGDAGDVVERPRVRDRPQGGESRLDLRRRVQRFVRTLREDLDHLPPGDVVLVGHGGSLQALTAVLLDLPPAAGAAFRFRNCCLTVITVSPQGRHVLVSHNDCGHYEG